MFPSLCIFIFKHFKRFEVTSPYRRPFLSMAKYSFDLTPWILTSSGEMVLTSRSATIKQITCYLSESLYAKYMSYIKIEIFKNDNDAIKEVLINHFKHWDDLVIFPNCIYHSPPWESSNHSVKRQTDYFMIKYVFVIYFSSIFWPASKIPHLSWK